MRYVLIGIFFSINFLHAQTESFKNWFSASLSYDFNKNWSASLEQGWRFEELYYDITYNDLTLKYKWNDYFRTYGTWRFARSGEFFNAEHLEHRLQIDLIGLYDFDRWRIMFRTRFQSEYRDPFVSDFGLQAKSYMRNRLYLKYRNIDKWEPELGIESYYSLSRRDDNYIDKLRFYIGVEREINDFQELEITYFIQPETQTAEPHTSYVLSLSYSFSISDYLKYRKEQKAAGIQKINWYRLPNE